MLCLKELRHTEKDTESCVTWLHPYKNRLSVRTPAYALSCPEVKIILHGKSQCTSVPWLVSGLWQTQGRENLFEATRALITCLPPWNSQRYYCKKETHPHSQSPLRFASREINRNCSVVILSSNLEGTNSCNVLVRNFKHSFYLHSPPKFLVNV